MVAKVTKTYYFTDKGNIGKELNFSVRKEIPLSDKFTESGSSPKVIGFWDDLWGGIKKPFEVVAEGVENTVNNLAKAVESLANGKVEDAMKHLGDSTGIPKIVDELSRSPAVNYTDHSSGSLINFPNVHGSKIEIKSKLPSDRSFMADDDGPSTKLDNIDITESYSDSSSYTELAVF